MPYSKYQFMSLRKPRIQLSEDQESYIRDYYLEKPIKRLANDIGVSQQVIRQRLKLWGLTIPKELAEERKRAFQFKKGQEPMNKGVPMKEWMSEESIKKASATRFQKGHSPHNEKFDGHISWRKDSSGIEYAHIRVKKGHYLHLHRVIWQNENGEIPKGMIVAFKDGDRSNFSIENLELISREENMLRNSRHGYHKEIIPSMILMNKIKEQIKLIQNGEK